jgi:hypothetical protein
MFKAYKEAIKEAPRKLDAFEQKLENRDAYSKTMDFYQQKEIVDKLVKKLVDEGMVKKDAITQAWKMVREGSHVFQDLDDIEVEQPIKEIKKGITINSHTSEVYKLVNKALLIVNNICSKHRNEKKYINLKKYFEKLNGKVK